MADKIWYKNYPQGTPKTINPELYENVGAVFTEAVAKFSDRVAFSNMGAKMTYQELDKLSSDFASFLQNTANIKPGDRIAIQMPNLLQYPVALFGALKAGAVIVNTNPLYTQREMKHQFKDSGAKAIVILANFAHQLADIIKDTDIKTVVVSEIGDMLGWPKSLIVNAVVKHIKKMVPKYNLPGAYGFIESLNIGAEKKFNTVKPTLEDLAFLQYTGGTTGVAKGAMLTHRNIVANMLQVSEWMKIGLKEGEEICVTALPLYHIFSLTVNCMSFIRFGGTNLLVTNPKDIPAFIKMLRTEKFTVITGVNTLFNALMNYKDFNKINFKQLKLSVAGGMALQKAVAQRWNKMTDTTIYEGYGLTETSPVACCNPIEKGKDRVGTIGLPLPSTDIKVIDDNGKDLGLNVEGEICIHGPQVMKGYWNRDDETALVMLPGGWIKTGDMAIINNDGFAQIVDRKKDMILVSGFNVYPNEVEDVIAAHPKVLEVAAIGIDNEHSGEVVKVFIVPRDKSLIKEEIIEHCKSNLVNYKVPKEVEFKTELPKTNVGKILRRALREPKQ
jgi:long-chain acyl-CoA synthetase